jgi:hypothetical protein
MRQEHRQSSIRVAIIVDVIIISPKNEHICPGR